MTRLHQIVYQNKIETLLEETTLEEASDMTYTNQQIQDEWNGGGWMGSVAVVVDTNNIMITKYDYDENHKSHVSISIINIPVLVASVKQQLEKSKEAFIDVSEMALENMSNQNRDCFKPQGFMFRPTKGVFVKYKAPKKKVVMSKSLLNELRRNTVFAITSLASCQFKLEIEIKGAGMNKEDQGKVVAFGIALGYTFKQIEEMSGAYLWDDLTPEKRGYEFKSVRHQVTTVLTERGQEEMIEATIKEYQDWLISSAQLKIK